MSLAQVQILNKVLTNKDLSIISLNELTEDYFADYKTEYNFIKNHYDLYHQVPDKLTFLDNFPEFDLVDVSEPDSYLVDQLYQDYNQAYLAKRFNDIKKMLENDQVEKATDYFLRSVDNLHKGSAMTCTDLITDTGRYSRYEERTTDPTRFYLTTGFPQLDEKIGGIDRENEDMVIIARPGVGKTQLLLKMAAEASKQGLKVGIYEGEMTVDKVGYRIDTFLSHIKNSAMNRGDIMIKNDYCRYINDLPSLGYGPIKVLTQNDVPSGIVSVDTLKAFIEKENLDILFVDQYSLLDDKQPAKTDFEHVGNIAKAIKKLQVEKKIPIISVSQMNRTKNENGEQDTTQVAGSDKIPQYATTVIALEQKQNEITKTVNLTLNIIKARDGGDHNKLVYEANFNTGRFDYIPTDKDGITNNDEFNNMAQSYVVDTDSQSFDRF